MTLECSLLYVKDLPRMRDFYSRLLQTPPLHTEWTGTWALFEAGGAKLALHAHSEGREPSSPAAIREGTPIKLIFAVADVQAERARLESLGVATLQRSWQQPAESCDCVDPEGNIFQIAARLRLPNLFGQPTAHA
jgi:predicted enzyme related to lactoylglutathione lyase